LSHQHHKGLVQHESNFAEVINLVSFLFVYHLIAMLKRGTCCVEMSQFELKTNPWIYYRNN